ncbi:putative uncharacterized protein [Prevotella sp. CAG:1185]|nr:putative uncharacterized protein [Prevotella sp. CAG:1185]
MDVENYKIERGNNSTEYFLNIADFIIKIFFENKNISNIDLLPSLDIFRTDNNKNCNLLFDLSVIELLPDISFSYKHIGTFDTGNGDTIIYAYTNGDYKFVIKDIDGNISCELLTNAIFSKCLCRLNRDVKIKRFGLNNALMMAFAFAGSLKKTLLIHASSIHKDGYGYAFIAKSGTGKSTHTGLWIKNISHCDLLNDDNPIIRFINNVPYLYGSPWSGKTPCYRNIKTKLGAITRIERAETNYIKKLKPTDAFASILPCCSTMKWDKNIYNAICNNVIKVIEKVNVYTLYCLPNKNAAFICHNQISRQKI